MLRVRDFTARFCARVLIAVAACLPFLSCGTIHSGVETGRTAQFFGMVYGGDHQPVSGASVFVDGKQTAISDDGGRFLVRSLSFGRHGLVVTKPGREPVRTTVEFLDRTTVFYATMFSAEELTGKALTAMQNGRLASAHDLIVRAEALDPSSIDAEFADACISIASGRHFIAAQSLRNAIARGGRAPELYLLLARTLAFGVGNSEAALQVLDRAGGSIDDPRIAILRAELMKNVNKGDTK